MKKIIITAVLLVFSTWAAKAADFSALSLTAGLASNTSVFSATAKETSSNEDGGTAGGRIQKNSGVFAESFSSQFVELGVGRFISLGFEHTPDSISTPQNINSDGNTHGGNCSTTGTDLGSVGACGNTTTVSADFNDMNTTYIKLNIPGGMYVKYGSVETDADFKETTKSGNTYKNISLDGTSMGAGYQRFLGESGFGFRFEANYLDFDNGKTDNGVATTGNHNLIEASNIEGATAKLAITYTLGRNN